MLDGSIDKGGPQDISMFGDANQRFIDGLPEWSGSFTGFWDDTDPGFTIKPKNKPRRGGNQHGHWITFDADVVDDQTGETVSKTVRMGVLG